MSDKNEAKTQKFLKARLTDSSDGTRSVTTLDNRESLVDSFGSSFAFTKPEVKQVAPVVYNNVISNLNKQLSELRQYPIEKDFDSDKNMVYIS